MIFLELTGLNCNNLYQYWDLNFEEKDYCTQALAANFCKLICKRLSTFLWRSNVSHSKCTVTLYSNGKKELHSNWWWFNWDLTWITSMNNLLSNLWNSLPSVCAIDLPTLVLPTPGGPTKQRIGPVKLIKS